VVVKGGQFLAPNSSGSSFRARELSTWNLSASGLPSRLVQSNGGAQLLSKWAKRSYAAVKNGSSAPSMSCA